MNDSISKFCSVVRHSSDENEKAINILFENKIYKKVIGTLREELELYVKVLYLSQQDSYIKETLIDEFFENKTWKNSNGKRLTDKELLNYASKVKGYGWEQVSYKFSCCFIHFSILHNWLEEDVTNIIDIEEKKTIIGYINQYHNAKLDINSSFEDILQYSLLIFKKIKENMECYIEELEENI